MSAPAPALTDESPLLNRTRIERILRYLSLPADTANLILDQYDLAVVRSYDHGRRDGHAEGRRDGWDACGARIAEALDQRYQVGDFRMSA